MNCKHCTTARRELNEIAESCGRDSLPGWGVDPEVDAKLLKRPYAVVDETAIDCNCECHVPARIVGKLPRLAS